MFVWGGPPHVLFLGEGWVFSFRFQLLHLPGITNGNHLDMHTTHGGSPTYSRTYRQEAGKRRKERSPLGANELFSSSFSKWRDGLSLTT